jgi:hypothetical protein
MVIIHPWRSSLTRLEMPESEKPLVMICYFRYLTNVKLYRSFNGPLKFLSIIHQTSSNYLFYGNLNSVNTRYVLIFSYWVAQLGASNVFPYEGVLPWMHSNRVHNRKRAVTETTRTFVKTADLASILLLLKLHRIIYWH